MIFENMDRIIFAGDSVTDMGSAQPVGEGLFDNMGHGYPARHREPCDGDLPGAEHSFYELRHRRQYVERLALRAMSATCFP